MKKILYISSLSSKRLINRIHIMTGFNPGFAVQKFNRFIALGLQQNGVEIKIYSKPPMGVVVGKSWINEPTEIEENLTYHYLNYLNLPILKDIFTFCSSFWQVLKFGLNNRKNKAVVCDVLAISMNIGAILASKITRLKIVGVVTDMPGLMVDISSKPRKRSLLKRFITMINMSYISSYTHYVFLTEQMNRVINTRNRPYIVMEALCDNSFNNSQDVPVEKAVPRIVMYAGGLHERYGLKKLVDAFRIIKKNNVKLILFGDGPYVDELQHVVNEDSRIEYRGVVSNEEVLRTELEATLLVNPRPITEEFTKYSFPSKNIEYMASGTPLLTTKLPGMPKDYYPYVYLFEDESVRGYAAILDEVLSLPTEDLIAKGKEAKTFVLENKNYKVQAARILNLIIDNH